MNPTRAEILALVNSRPCGVTTADVRRELGGSVYALSGILSRLAAYGIINAAPLHRKAGNLWSPKKIAP